MAKRNRYKELEQLMSAILIACTIIFILYLIVAANGIIWLKVLTAVLVIVPSILALGFLYLTKELLRKRSLWLSAGFFSLFLCNVVSLLLRFP